MRLIGSFHTMTTHSRAGLTTSWSEGRSTSVGAIVGVAVPIARFSLAGRGAGTSSSSGARSATLAGDDLLTMPGREDLHGSDHPEGRHELVHRFLILRVDDQEQSVAPLLHRLAMDVDAHLLGIRARDVLKQHGSHLGVAGRAGLGLVLV